MHKRWHHACACRTRKQIAPGSLLDAIQRQLCRYSCVSTYAIQLLSGCLMPSIGEGRRAQAAHAAALPRAPGRAPLPERHGAAPPLRWAPARRASGRAGRPVRRGPGGLRALRRRLPPWQPAGTRLCAPGSVFSFPGPGRDTESLWLSATMAACRRLTHALGLFASR